MGVTSVKNFFLLPLYVFMVGCASQFQHPIKKTAEFYEDLEWCEKQADVQGYPYKGATRDNMIDGCLGRFGWNLRRSGCFSRHLGTRMPASEHCQ